ncbi:MAG TPA: RsmD family RNA methyltransferase [Thermoanaerobaculia bacterium]|nr:RsmD family RNA methyltransferase [Thermoanaerobaculia bacterium]
MSSLRITAGTLRGRRVPVPQGEVRPTSERARQAYFNIVGDRIEGARFLDLFAGSGIFTFEALSRGAGSATAIDRNITTIARTAAQFGIIVNAIAGEVLAVLKRLTDSFDLVYADPPYAYDRYDELVAAIARVAPGALVAVEHRRHTSPFNRGPEPFRTEEYGEVRITFFKPSLPQELQ